MDWVKRRSTTSSSSPDEAAMAKAAAWAWYQHGSGNGPPCSTSEFDLGRRGGRGAFKPRRPSRYKEALAEEAAAAASEQHEDEEACGLTVPLLNVCEVERITRELEGFNAASDGGHGDQRKGRGGEEQEEAAGEGRSTADPSRAARKVGGPWVRHAAGICSSSGATRSTADASRAARKVGGPWVQHAAGMCWAAEDVVEAAVTVAGRRLGKAATVASKIRCDRIR